MVHESCNDNTLCRPLSLSKVNVDIKAEQRCAIDFCCRLETVRMLNEAYGDGVLDNPRIQRWPAAFMKGHKSAELICMAAGSLLPARKQ